MQQVNVFYIGLSHLSIPRKTPEEKRKALSSEARRILGAFDQGISDRDIPIARASGGRPYFTDFHADFNISHSRNMAALAFSRAGSLSPRSGQKGRVLRVGCDIQYVNPHKNHVTITERFFSGAERDYIAAGSGENRRFCMIWALKECWLKLRGLSVFDMAKAPIFYVESTPRKRSPEESPPADFHLYELEGEGERYMLAAARERAYDESAAFPRDSVPPPLLRWFSGTTLRVSSIDEIYAVLSPEKTAMPKS
ncbi:MAG: 4'-phosphopantetheinyl transferase superfamily protein [Treponema sp.]|jgi:phosphopantetheinyl transferase|nr:4'-phosphopantetheinyl transferase superfamily protein [Treponema sp.]